MSKNNLKAQHPSQNIGLNKESTEMLSLLIEAVNDYAIFALDPNGIILSWNSGARRLKGYEASEVIGTHFSRFYTEADLIRNHPNFELKEALKNGSYEEEGWRVTKSGEKFWASVVITTLKDSAGVHQGFAKVTRDLTSKKIAEDKLRESEERFRLLINNVMDYAIITLDTKGNIVTWNAGAQRIKVYKPSEIIGKHFSIFYTAEDIKHGRPEMQLKIAEETGRYEEENWRLRKDGTPFWANATITAMKDENNILRGFAKITRDLTERKQSEDELQLAYQNLEERVKERTAELALAKEDAENAVASRDEFLSIASHELKTPLTSLKLQIQSRKRQLAKGNIVYFSQDTIYQMVDQDEKQINRISRLVDDMLEITHISSGKLSLDFEETDLGLLVIDVLNRFSLQLQENNITLVTNISSGIIGSWDRYKIEQIFINLLTNAVKYGENKPIEIEVKEKNNNAILSVRDHGIGIKKDDHERVFQQFERAISASSISGLGLGLYIVNKLIEYHKGTISIQSEIGKGSTFIVELPLKN